MPTSRHHRILAIIAWPLVWVAPAIPGHAGGSGTTLAPELRLESLEDADGGLTFDDVLALDDRFSAVDEDNVNYGFTSSAYWFRARLDRPDPGDRLLLQLSYPLLDHVDLHLRYDDGNVEHTRSGDSLPFDQRAFRHRSFVFPIEFGPDRDSADVYVRVATGSSMQVPVSVWTPEAFHERDHDGQLVLGLYYGLLLAILLYNAMLALSVRESVYACYALYVLAYGLFQMCLNGLAFEYLWPSSTYLADRGTLIFMSLSATLATLFSRQILEIGSRRGRLQTVFRLYTLCSAATLPLCFVVPYPVAIKAQTLLVLVGACLFAVAGVIKIGDGVAAARFYLAAWALFLLGIVVYSLKTYALLPENVFTEYAIQAGSALEVLLLSFAIAHRFKVMREDRIRLQRESNALLEERVVERTAALEHALEKLSAANERLQTLSITDALSGLHNRAHFNARFESMWAEARRDRNSIAVLMIDIDHFKSVNDDHGHLVGDRVIAAVGRTIAGSIHRAGDLVARYGGEEFVVVLPSTVSENARHVAERIRAAIASDRNERLHAAGAGRMTVSIGVAAEVPSPHGPSSRSELLLAAADSALYGAKRGGRNRVCSADDDSLRQDTIARRAG